MANPFGRVIDNFEIERLDPNHPKPEDINQLHRARSAFSWRLDNNKSQQAQNYVTELKRSYGSGTSTHVVIFNATGFSLNFRAESTLIGRLYRTPYPWEIGNGQWVSFLHTGDTTAGLVYSCTNKFGLERDVYFGWRTVGGPGGGTGNRNRVYADVIPRGGSLTWDAWRNALSNASSSNTYNKNGVEVNIDIASGTSPFLTVIIKLPGI
ncbi:23 kDa jasmonate-induced protein [Beta vulgaris subsp. vulgaris]|uniref:23 kDa jasmonate-induced protein n=1 Tax=Beta vulgaris subsp. vulgaris TaxID=3555 RepID=UPI0020375E09|nr:23 kDa jasmonate-induced protein [Beta vulgaris subsp. vulgaris]